MQRSLLIQADPILTLIFSSMVSSLMAPVGQTWVQSEQKYSQYPIRGLSTGVQIPSGPASSRAGCRPLVGQAFMHSLHLTHFWRNFGSGRAAGGRMSVAAARLPPRAILENGAAK